MNKTMNSVLTYAGATLFVFLAYRYQCKCNQSRQKPVYTHFPGPCTRLKGIENGSEDIQALPNGLTFISSGLRFWEGTRNQEPFKSRKGQIMLYDLNKPAQGALPLTIQGGDLQDFNPHGISLWDDSKTQTVHVFVVNHPPGAETVEIFTFNPKSPSVLKHQRTITDLAILFPNDLVAVGQDKFYITNYSYYHGPGWFAWLEQMFGFAWGTVAYFDGQRGKIVAKGLLTPNGINKSLDGRYVYVVDGSRQEVITYKRTNGNDLVDIEHFPMGTFPDNIDVASDSGDLWLGCHQDRLRTRHNVRHDPAYAAPSQVLHIKTENGRLKEICEVYSEDGTRYVSASATAVKFNNTLLIGTVTNSAAVCQLTTPQC